MNPETSTLTCQSERANTGNKARQKAVEWERSHQ